MIAEMPVRVAFVGIDGAGKTSLARCVTARLHASGIATGSLYCPSYHLAGAVPHARLSEALALASRLADERHAHGLKLIIQYLQMTLYGSVEQHLLESRRLRYLISDRHAIIDTITYGPVYGVILAHAGASPRDPLAQLKPELERRMAGSWEAIAAWHLRHCQRLGIAATVDEIPGELAELQNHSLITVIDALSRRYETSVPEVVCLIDTPPPSALARLAARRTVPREAHESLEYLSAIREMYVAALEALQEQRAATILRVDAPADRCLDSLADEILANL